MRPYFCKEEIMNAWTITVHEDSTGRREQILIYPETPYVSTNTTLYPERLSAPTGCVVALAGDRVTVYQDKETAETKERDAITRLFDDQGNRLR